MQEKHTDKQADSPSPWRQQALRDGHVPDDAELAALSRAVAAALLAADAQCTTAESCTGGLVAKLLTDTAGSSAWFSAGFVCYSNASKHSMLAVPQQLIERCGAVSGEVVEALCAGAIAHSGADIAVAISGVAGPSGGSPQKPVGTVWIACSGPRHSGQSVSAAERVCEIRHFLFSGSRDDIRRAAAAQALRGILALLNSDDVPWSPK